MRRTILAWALSGSARTTETMCLLSNTSAFLRRFLITTRTKPISTGSGKRLSRKSHGCARGRARYWSKNLARLKIYTDENVDVRVAEGLRRRGVEAVSAYGRGKERQAGFSDAVKGNETAKRNTRWESNIGA